MVIAIVVRSVSGQWKWDSYIKCIVKSKGKSFYFNLDYFMNFGYLFVSKLNFENCQEK